MTTWFPSKLVVLLFFLATPLLLQARPFGYENERGEELPVELGYDNKEADLNNSEVANHPAPPSTGTLHLPAYNRQPGTAGGVGGSRRPSAPPPAPTANKLPHHRYQSGSGEPPSFLWRPVDVLLRVMLDEVAGRAAEVAKTVRGGAQQ